MMGANRKPQRSSAVLILIGTLLIVVGVWKLASRLLWPWWGVISRAISQANAIIWPLCIIIAGAAVIVVARKGRLTSTQGRLMRSSANARIAGVCGGVAECYSMDAAVVRVGWLLLVLPTFGIALLLYCILWALVPQSPSC